MAPSFPSARVRAARDELLDDDTLSVHFWGVRGSYPVADRRVDRFGGNTACVEVRLGHRLFIIDAGTGIVGLGQMLAGSPITEVDILLSHLHHDHVSGLAFFEPLFRAGVTVRIHCGNLGGQDASEALGRMYAAPLFPLSLDEVPATIVHVGFTAGQTLGFGDGVEVATCLLNHPGGATGYRFNHAGRTLCYLSDMEHAQDGHPADLVGFARDADVVVYDATFTEAEFARFKGWGHSTCEAGVDLCRRAGARALAAFHHHPLRDDDAIEAIETQLAASLPGSFHAREVHSIAVGSPDSYPGMLGT